MYVCIYIYTKMRIFSPSNSKKYWRKTQNKKKDMKKRWYKNIELYSELYGIYLRK